METTKENQNNPQNQLQECQKLKDEYLAGWQRERADFLNYQKEEKEKVHYIIDSAKKEWLLRFLDLADNLEIALKHQPQDLRENEWVKAVLEIYGNFLANLQKEGLKEINALGEKFDPNFHEAIEKIEAEGKESGEITQVLQKGYLLNGRLLRPAKVKVIR